MDIGLAKTFIEIVATGSFVGAAERLHLTQTAVSARVLGGAGALALRSRRRPVVSGVEAMLGTTAEALEAFEREGWVRASGERWRARSAAPLACGERARIVAVEGLLLVVEPEVGKGERI